ncbi:MAG: lipocalin family protein [Polaribacter sp.]|nr:lipocalin family protein [Polaribacter sp.]
MQSYIFKITALLLFFTAISCSDSPENEAVFNLVGEWNIKEKTENGFDVLDNCQARSLIKFNSDGTFVSSLYYSDNGSFLDCELDEIQNGGWELKDKSIYIGIDLLFEIDIIDNDTFMVTEEDGDKIEIWVRDVKSIVDSF